MNSAPVLQFSDVCFAYERAEVVHNVSLAVANGSLAAVVGPNGGGKSTLLKLALGLLRPRRGRVTLFGNTPEKTRRRAGYVPQHVHFDPAFPVRAIDVVMMGRTDKHWFGPYRADDRAAAQNALERVHGTHLIRRGFSELSGGERQRVLIAQALSPDPEVLFLDEPTASVDHKIELEIYELLHELNAQMTVIVVSHNLNVVTRHASHLVCVNRTASIAPISSLTEGDLHAIHRGDMTVLQHEEHCHVIDPAAALSTPHRAGDRQ
jgi:zinc transport system ATP-binding protein